jgi:hypothetical protein
VGCLQRFALPVIGQHLLRTAHSGGTRLATPLECRIYAASSLATGSATIGCSSERAKDISENRPAPQAVGPRRENGSRLSTRPSAAASRSRLLVCFGFLVEIEQLLSKRGRPFLSLDHPEPAEFVLYFNKAASCDRTCRPHP